MDKNKPLNDEGSLYWWDRQEKRKKLRKKVKKSHNNKCINCIWGDSETEFCMFPKCFNDIEKRLKERKEK